MDTFYAHGFFWIIIVCVTVLLLMQLKKKTGMILSFVQRGMTGFLVITLLNKGFEALALDLFVGINVWTLLTSAILGIPGVCVLYLMNLF